MRTTRCRRCCTRSPCTGCCAGDSRTTTRRHLGGIAYLFIRGMAGPDTPRIDGVPCGVFSWRPPGALVVDLSDLLDGSVHETRPA